MSTFEVQVNYVKHRDDHNSMSWTKRVEVEARDQFHAQKVAAAMFEGPKVTIQSTYVYR